ncbi:MAG: hypothetical protein JSV22_12210 [Bacteroidales bacterium]|nr:MAG: hypothetical protein JSV22_12210 [Bacteroidales bacterium]
MKWSASYILLLFILSWNPGFSQDDKKPRNWELNGYVSNMQSVMYENLNDLWLTENLLHNRLNFNWHISEKLTFSLQFRNRFIYGDLIRFDQLLKDIEDQLDGDTASSITSLFGMDPGGAGQGLTGFSNYVDQIDSDNGITDLSIMIAKGNSYLLNMFFDRLWIQYTIDNLEITAGRQRINWGQTFVWNPNDIFNTYNFFDFDYPERPGSDAIRIQYYPGYTSTVEAAIKLDSAENITAAGLYRFNRWNYDIQLLGGILNSEDFVAGFGWSGNIKAASFRGELSYFHPRDNFSDTTGLFFASLSSEYVFKNSLMIQVEALYRQLPKGFDVSDFSEFYSGPLSVKKLSFTEYNIFSQATYPVTPLLNATLGGMLFLGEISGYYIGPSLSYSLMDNLDFSTYFQFFSGKFPDNEGIKQKQNFNLAFIRLKMSF